MEGINYRAQPLGVIAQKNDKNTYKISFEELDRILRRAGKFTGYYGSPENRKLSVTPYDEIQQMNLRSHASFYAIRFDEIDFEGKYKFHFYKKSDNPSNDSSTDHSSLRTVGHVFVAPTDIGKFFASDVTTTGQGGRRRKTRKTRKTRKSKRKARR